MDLNVQRHRGFPPRDHGYATFIHGHTHRPATHDPSWDGSISVERWVLSDWHEGNGPTRAECLVWDGEAGDEALHRENLTQRQLR